MTAIPTISRQTLRFFLQTAPGFTPPPAVQTLVDVVELDLVAGCQLLWTAVMNKSAVSYGDIYHWLALSDPNAKLHRFTDSSFGDDSEVGGDIASELAKVVGLAFMSEYAEACWFTVLRPFWGNVLTTNLGDISVSKNSKDAFGPDYLAAPFNPANAAAGGPFYAVEFKAQKAKVEFKSKTFKDWSKQAANIALRKEDGSAVNLKAWVLAFNYGFEKAQGSREESALLVDDPDVVPGEPSLEPDPINGSTIIRDHLSRQCRLLGAPQLAPYVRRGLALDGVKDLPPVYKIDNKKLAGRRYIGQWLARAPSGELVPAPSGWVGWPIMHRGSHHFVVGDPAAHIQVWIDGPDGPRARAWIERMFGGGDLVFVGQDATMLRRCTELSTDVALDGEPFQQEIHFVETSGELPSPKAIRVLRNGSVLAANATIELDEQSFWFQRPPNRG